MNESNITNKTIVTRFAPSPTGFMHVGGVRTALYAWAFARKHGGRFILRIEDTDKEREVEGSIPHIKESLTWLGITWDEGVDVGGPHAPYLQSERLDSYRKYAKILIEKGYAYPDPYSEEEISVLRRKAEDEKDFSCSAIIGLLPLVNGMALNRFDSRFRKSRATLGMTPCAGNFLPALKHLMISY